MNGTGGCHAHTGSVIENGNHGHIVHLDGGGVGMSHEGVVHTLDPLLALSLSMELAPGLFALAFLKQTGDIGVGQVGEREKVVFFIFIISFRFVVPTLYHALFCLSIYFPKLFRRYTSK